MRSGSQDEDFTDFVFVNVSADIDCSNVTISVHA